MKKYDIIILGGGLVGGCLAAALAKDFSVLLVDKKSLDKEIDPGKNAEPDYDPRLLAISAGSKEFLSRLGVWSLVEDKATPIEHINIHIGKKKPSPVMALHSTEHASPDLEPEPMGYMVPAGVMLKGVRANLDLSVVDKMYGCFGQSVHATIEKAYALSVLHTDQGSFKAPLIIGADGPNSWLRKQVGISSKISRSYHQAVVGDVAHEFEHENTAVQVFSPYGPVALLPNEGKTSSFVWSLAEPLHHMISSLSDAEFCARLEELIGDSRGAMELISPRVSYHTQALMPSSIVARRSCLVGDAAHVIHPVSGQGVNLGWRDVIVLSKILKESKRLGLDWGSEMVLKQYQRERALDTQLLYRVTDTLVRFLSTHNKCLHSIVNAGIKMGTKIPAVKYFIMHQGMGRAHILNNFFGA